MSAYPEIPEERTDEFRDSARRVFWYIQRDEKPWRVEALMRSAYLLGRIDGMADAREIFTAAMGEISASARKP